MANTTESIMETMEKNREQKPETEERKQEMPEQEKSEQGIQKELETMEDEHNTGKKQQARKTGYRNATEGNDRKRTVWLLLLIVCLAVAVVSGGILIKNHISAKRAQEELERLAQLTTLETTAPPETESKPAPAQTQTPAPEPTTEELFAASVAQLKEMEIPIPDKTVDFADLQENTNADIYAWIYIPDTKIDYPVVQHPTDNSYYLKYNLDGSKGYPGCIYTEDYNAKDFSDANTVLYGHNMKNGTMFAGLHQYEDAEFFEKNPYVYIYTPEKLLVYEVFAAYESGDEHLLMSYAFDNQTIFQNYLDDIFAMRTMTCNLNEKAEVDSGSHIVTLSTCIANKPNNRYLVQGVLLNEEADEQIER